MVILRFLFFILLSLPIQLTAFEAINLSIEETEVIPLSKYKEIQFPQCINTISKGFIKNDLLGSSKETLNRSESRSLISAGKKIRSYHKKILELRRIEEHSKILELATEALDFIYTSNIFNQDTLARFPYHNSSKYGSFILNGVPMDYLSAQQFSAMIIASIALESSKKIQYDELTQFWSEKGIKITRWIFNNRGCSTKIGVSYNSSFEVEEGQRVRSVGNICSAMYLKESSFAEDILIDALKIKNFDKVITLGSLSLTDLQMAPASQTSFKAAAFIRLNTLARLAYAAKKQENWCLVYEGNDRAIKLAKELSIEPLNSWMDSKKEASKYYLPNKEDSWTVRYGNMSYRNSKNLYMPLKQLPPAYPRRLLERGIEGCVMLSFTINKEGKTENAKVEWSTHEGFNKSALASSKSYEYSIPEKEGVPTNIPDVRTVIVYKIEDPNKSSLYIPAGCE